jgi:hypothetical protein
MKGMRMTLDETAPEKSRAGPVVSRTEALPTIRSHSDKALRLATLASEDFCRWEHDLRAELALLSEPEWSAIELPIGVLDALTREFRLAMAELAGTPESNACDEHAGDTALLHAVCAGLVHIEGQTLRVDAAAPLIVREALAERTEELMQTPALVSPHQL